MNMTRSAICDIENDCLDCWTKSRTSTSKYEVVFPNQVTRFYKFQITAFNYFSVAGNYNGSSAWWYCDTLYKVLQYGLESPVKIVENVYKEKYYYPIKKCIWLYRK